ncbi:MAG: hypothetical protein KAR79_05145 [Simkaniaceae bacterium]|nr:hypothetical protein [Simkaniaceae bacterium]
MTNFKKIFQPTPDHTQWPKTVSYKGKEVSGFDRFPVKNKEVLIFSIEKTNSKFIQGFGVGIFDGYIKINGTRTNKRKFCKHLFWEDSEVLDVKNIEFTVFTKGDHITICNIWEIEVTGYWGMRLKGWGKGTEEGFFKYDKPKKTPCYYGSGEWLLGKGNGSAMYSEDIEDGKRYFCNDGDLDDDFDDIIFTVKKLPK